MVNILVVTPFHRPTYIWYQSLVLQKYELGKMDMLQMYTGYAVSDNRGIQQICTKMNTARSIFLSGNYDYMVTLEDDNILQGQRDIDNLVQTAIEYDADVMYSPYVFRNAGNLSSCAVAMDTDKAFYFTAEKFKENYTHWLKNGSIVPCDGLGFGFTAIARRVLERIEFRVQTEDEIEQWGYISHSDTTFAIDCILAGFKQYTHFGITNGHIHYDETSCFVMVPDSTEDDFIRREYINV